MSHTQQRDFCRHVKEKFPDSFAGRLVLDIGSLDVNGSNRELFTECLYLGVDIAPGPNVDLVSIGHELALPDESFDTIISTECFEHDRYYPQTLKNIVRMLKPGGLFLFSCATTGRPEHGTRRSEPHAAPLLGKYDDWSDYYQNLTEQDVREVLDLDQQFSQHSFQVNPTSHDLYFCGIKAGEAVVRTDYSFVEHNYSAQLYVDTGSGFGEEHSALHPIPTAAFTGQPVELRFDLREHTGVRSLRLDPLDTSAVVEIEKVTVVTGEREVDLLPGVRTNAAGLVEGRYFFKSSDPQICLDDIDTRCPEQPQTLVARLRYLSTGQVAALQSEVAELRGALGQAKANLLATGAALEQTRAGAAESKAAHTAASAELAAARAEVDQLKRSLDEARGALGEKKSTLEQTLHALSAVRKELAAAHADQSVSANALEEALTELSRTSADMARLSGEADKHKAALEVVQTSRSWKVTAPLRRLGREVRERLSGSDKVDLVPVNDVHPLPGRRGEYWKATGGDPQFSLRPRRAQALLQGQWFTLEFEFECSQPVVQQLFVDYGVGFQIHAVLTLEVQRSGKVRIPVFLPRSYRGLRLDPMEQPGEFRLRKVSLVHSKRPLVGSPEHDQVNRILQTLDGVGFRLVPVNELSFNGTDARPWQSLGYDPVFLLEFQEPLQGLRAWHCAEVHVDADRKEGLAQFYFDTGKGFNEKETLKLPYGQHEQVERVFRIDRPMRALRFDPISEPGRFGIERLKFTALSEEEAVVKMVKRLAKHHKDYEGELPEKVLSVVTDLAHTRKRAVPEQLLRLCAETYDFQQTGIDYTTWIDNFEEPSLPTPAEVTARLAQLAARPVISVVMPVYNTSETHLRECIDSVLAQSYPHWELCIADDASTRAHVRPVLEEYRARDPRIRVVYRAENGHISRASNSALEIAQGEYVALLDHDDVLATHALYFFACAIDEAPGAQILYSDEDKIDDLGSRFDPHFKSDWNPDLFFSQNYVSHLGIYRRDLLVRIGGFRPGVEGSQDQDLMLRCLPHVRHEQIAHVARVLYHWRAAAGSTAMSSYAKSYTSDAGIKALRDYFTSIGTAVTVEAAVMPNTYRVQYAIPAPQPLVSLLIPTRDMSALLIACVESIVEKTTYANYEILILDNGSVEPDTLAYFEKIQRADPRVRVLRYDHPFNYSSINNFGVKHAKGEIIGLINNDIEVIAPDWLTEMVSHACRPEIGCVGAKLYYGDNTVQHGGVILGLGGVAGHSHKRFPKAHAGYFARLMLTQNLSAVTAACLLVRREVYEQVGGLDEENLKIAFNDVDFCLKVREAGFRALWTPYAELYHFESISRGAEDNPAKVARFQREIAFMTNKWGKALQFDPFYSPHLTRVREDFTI